MKIASSMAIATLETQALVKAVPCRIVAREKIGLTSACMQFQTLDAQAISYWRKWYTDFNGQGRYFMVYNSADVKRKRHYGVCCSSQPKFYAALIRMVAGSLQGTTPTEDLESFFSSK